MSASTNCNGATLALSQGWLAFNGTNGSRSAHELCSGMRLILTPGYKHLNSLLSSALSRRLSTSCVPKKALDALSAQYVMQAFNRKLVQSGQQWRLRNKRAMPT